MISKEDLESQIASLEQQRAAGIRMVQTADGALQLARHLLGVLMKKEDDAANVEKAAEQK